MFTPTSDVKGLSFAFLPETLMLVDDEYNSPIDDYRYAIMKRFRDDPSPAYLMSQSFLTVDYYVYAMAGYCHEMNAKAGTHAATYGEFLFTVADHKDSIAGGRAPDRLSYEELLTITPTATSYDGFRRNAYNKIGFAKPRVTAFDERGPRDLLTKQYDAASHQNMLINPNDVPLHADGWYKKTNRKPYEKP